MSRQLISSEKFPPKPHNCKSTVNPRWSTVCVQVTNNQPCAGPATKVPGLVFCAGQTATGEIKQATVRCAPSNRIADTPLTRACAEDRSSEPQGGARALWLVARAGCQVQCLLG